MRKASEILEIMEVFRSRDSNPPTELDYTNAFTLLVAIVLSAQSTDKGVNKATKELFKIADMPQKMVDLGLDKLKDYIKTIGLYNTKAKNIIALSESLIKDYNGEVPDSREALVKLAGVGRKTANVLMNVWFNKPTVAVDTHVMRIAERLELSDGKKDPLKVEADLDKALTDDYKLHVNHWLVLFGRYICKAQKPDCINCPVARFCKSKDKRI